jgi:AraC-like DNA-binding protein
MPANSPQGADIRRLSSPASERMDRRVADVLTLISTRFFEPLTLEYMAHHVHLSRHHLVRLFRRFAKTTPYASLLMTRLQTATEQLLRTHLSVKEIAGNVGMADRSHFVKAFVKAYGCSPTAYRRNHHDVAMTSPVTAAAPPQDGQRSQAQGKERIEESLC